jgi:hypothetical protein
VAGLESEANEASDCDLLLLSTVDDAVLPARVRRVLRDSGTFSGAGSCFFASPLSFAALTFDFVAVSGDSTSLKGLTSRGGSGLGTRRPSRFERFLFHGVELPGACAREGVPSLRCVGVVPADVGCMYGE